ncbi:MAG: hypothetical protein JSW20_04845 [Nitrospiraceae bacterium]|nr:MAG: hypothetical protein JSW20_04845 [Nitrospiraceae bacterium]
MNITGYGIHGNTLINVLGVVFEHLKTDDDGDLYLTRYAQKFRKHLSIENWFEKRWFNNYKIPLKGTGSVYKVPTKEVDGISLDFVVKNCRVGEDVPLDTHTLEEFCNAEFNSPWEEFSLVEEMREGKYGPKHKKIKTQLPMAIYVPPEKMQLWQSGRSRSKINKIRMRHPGIDLDILKQYKLVYRWIEGYNLPEIFEFIAVDTDERKHHLVTLDQMVVSDMSKKGYLVADTKPDHIIISTDEAEHIMKLGSCAGSGTSKEQITYLYHLIEMDKYSIIDYELLLRTPDHEQEVKDSRRHSYLDNQINRYTPTPVPSHLSSVKILGVPYIFGHAESTGGNLWVVGNNAHLFDYFLPERWRKTHTLRLPGSREIYYTITKDNVRLAWETSCVGEMPRKADADYDPLIKKYGINSPFEEFAIAHDLTSRNILCAYVRAIYMTGSCKIEKSRDVRRYESHKNILNPDGSPVLMKNRNYITIRGYYNGPDYWVARQTGQLYERVDLADALTKGLIDAGQCQALVERKKNKLKKAGYEGSLLKPQDLLMSIDQDGNIVNDSDNTPVVVICNFQYIWYISESVHNNQIAVFGI